MKKARGDCRLCRVPLADRVSMTFDGAVWLCEACYAGVRDGELSLDCVYFVYGNGGAEVLADNLDSFDAAMQEVARIVANEDEMDEYAPLLVTVETPDLEIIARLLTIDRPE